MDEFPKSRDVSSSPSVSDTGRFVSPRHRSQRLSPRVLTSSAASPSAMTNVASPTMTLPTLSRRDRKVQTTVLSCPCPPPSPGSGPPPAPPHLLRPHQGTVGSSFRPHEEQEETVTRLPLSGHEALTFDILLSEDVLRLLLLFCSAREAVALSGVSSACRTALMTAVSLEPLWYRWWLERRFQYWPYVQYPPLHCTGSRQVETPEIPLSSVEPSGASSLSRGEESLLAQLGNVDDETGRLTWYTSSSRAPKRPDTFLALPSGEKRGQHDSRTKSVAVAGGGGGGGVQDGRAASLSPSSLTLSNPRADCGKSLFPPAPLSHPHQQLFSQPRPPSSPTVSEGEECSSAATTAFSTTGSTAALLADHGEVPSHISSPPSAQSSLPGACPPTPLSGAPSRLCLGRGLSEALQNSRPDLLEEKVTAFTQKSEQQQEDGKARHQKAQGESPSVSVRRCPPHTLSLPQGINASLRATADAKAASHPYQSPPAPLSNWRTQLLWSERTLRNWTAGVCTRSRIQSPDHSFLSVAVYPSYDVSNCVCRGTLSSSSCASTTTGQPQRRGPSRNSPRLSSQRQVVGKQQIARGSSFEGEDSTLSTSSSSTAPIRDSRTSLSGDWERAAVPEVGDTLGTLAAPAVPPRSVVPDLGRAEAVIGPCCATAAGRVRQGGWTKVDDPQSSPNTASASSSREHRDQRSSETTDPPSSSPPRVFITSQHDQHPCAAQRQEATRPVSSDSSSPPLAATRQSGLRTERPVVGSGEREGSRSDRCFVATPTPAEPAVPERHRDFRMQLVSSSKGNEFDRILHMHPCLFTVSSDRIAIHQYMPLLGRKRVTAYGDQEASSSSRTKKKNCCARGGGGKPGGGGSNRSLDRKCRSSHLSKAGLAGAAGRDVDDGGAFLPKVLSSPSLPPVSVGGPLSSPSYGGTTTDGWSGAGGGRHSSGGIERLQSDLDLYELYLWQQTGATPNNVKGIPTTPLDSSQFESLHHRCPRGVGAPKIGLSSTESPSIASPLRQPRNSASVGVGVKGPRHHGSGRDANKASRTARRSHAQHSNSHQRTSPRNPSVDTLLVGQVSPAKTTAPTAPDAPFCFSENKDEKAETRRSATAHSSCAEVPPPFSLEPSYGAVFDSGSSPHCSGRSGSGETPDLQLSRKEGRRPDVGEDDDDDDACGLRRRSAGCPVVEGSESSNERSKARGDVLSQTARICTPDSPIRTLPSGSESTCNSSSISSCPLLYARRPLGDGDVDEGGSSGDRAPSSCTAHRRGPCNTAQKKKPASYPSTPEGSSDGEGNPASGQTPEFSHVSTSRSLSFGDAIPSTQQERNPPRQEPLPPPSVFVISRLDTEKNQRTSLLSCRVHPPTGRMACCLLASGEDLYDKSSLDSLKCCASGAGGTGRRRKKSAGGGTAASTPRRTPRCLSTSSPGRWSSSGSSGTPNAPCQGRLYDLRGGEVNHLQKLDLHWKRRGREGKEGREESCSRSIPRTLMYGSFYSIHICMYIYVDIYHNVATRGRQPTPGATERDGESTSPTRKEKDDGTLSALLFLPSLEKPGGTLGAGDEDSPPEDRQRGSQVTEISPVVTRQQLPSSVLKVGGVFTGRSRVLVALPCVHCGCLRACFHCFLFVCVDFVVPPVPRRQLAWNLAVDGASWYPLRLHFVFSDDGSLLFAYDRWSR